MSSGLSYHVEAYHQWKNTLIREIAHYQSWLRTNQLNSDDLELKLQRCAQLLHEDNLTIAFVGEFSRGKTELINALFFAEFGQRMLPSQAGRTTMCPTELFYDRDGGSYLKLLPIETRSEEKSLADYKRSQEHWVYYPLDMTTPESMRESLDQVARTRTVSFEEARRLGFELGSLERDPSHPGMAIIPAWRHALISLENPMLQQGLRILDTPGLNALGSEPELTVSMIPNAHAVIFMLGADTGVTASDMEIWTNHIFTEHSDHRAGRFAVLNKIDVLWDDIQGEEHTNKAIAKVQSKTADQLGLKPEEVLLLSAKQALVGRIKGDEQKLRSSRLDDLEALLTDRILGQKERLITHNVVNDVLGMLQTSQAILQSRYSTYQEKLEEYESKGVSADFLRELTDKTQDDYNFYYKKLFTLRSSRRLMKSQAMILNNLVNLEHFESHAKKTRDELINSWTTIGMGRAMAGFFHAIENDISNLNHEARLAQKMVGSIYQRYANDARSSHLRPAPFTITKQIREIEGLKMRADKFRRNPRTLVSEQTVVVKRFFTVIVSEARRLYDEIHKESDRWPQEALLPILQHTIEQKQLLEHQIRRLKDLAKTAKDTRSQVKRIVSMMEEINQEIQEAEQIQRKLRRPAPQMLSQKVVSLPGMQR
ncbi:MULTISPECIES: dynamin family protein [unclassified Hahella]|uniref:dynamin family protein n=1 Tax=unclassified Hahella TaxID=2624107 RepID=UPI001C1ED8C7|nr:MULTISPECIES: dynamin family protein [unclassified Hahella]MBU6952683.1 dynamin family protein [Hahella sp. HN01]MDG9667102.1 dynamin family protein [Hahella sp. CR1]